MYMLTFFFYPKYLHNCPSLSVDNLFVKASPHHGDFYAILILINLN